MYKYLCVYLSLSLYIYIYREICAYTYIYVYMFVECVAVSPGAQGLIGNAWCKKNEGGIYISGIAVIDVIEKCYSIVQRPGQHASSVG